MEISYYGGVTLEQAGNEMGLYQTVYCTRLLESFGLEKAKATQTSMVDNIDKLFEEVVAGEAG